MGPLVGQLYVMPFSNKQTQDITTILAREAESQLNLSFIYSNLTNCDDYVVQLLLYTVSSGTWPPYSYIIMKHDL
jgi:hypothetical protein